MQLQFIYNFSKRFFSNLQELYYLKKLKTVTLIFKAASYWQNLINKPTYLVLLRIYFIYVLISGIILLFKLSCRCFNCIFTISVYKNYYLHVYFFLFLWHKNNWQINHQIYHLYYQLIIDNCLFRILQKMYPHSNKMHTKLV